ncbi:hypothetical protein T8T21_02180 [Limimaricola variabilis]|nr:hypothetical protein [Limimaricola variabilis]WPY94952.1 hypothetical protein T8T21_02180 [Limimaricola variabilis]
MQQEEAIDLFGKLPGKARGQQSLSDTGQDPAFKLFPCDRTAVLALLAALGLASVAAVAVLSGDRVASAAATAFDDPIEDIPSTVAVVQRCRFARILLMRGREAILYRVPNLVLDDCELRRIPVDPVVRIGRTREAITSLGIAVEAVSPVNDDADIRLVAQHAVPLLGIAPDGAVVPFASGRGGNTLLVQGRGNLAGRQAVGVVIEDALYDSRLLRDDFTIQSPRAGDDAIAIRKSGGHTSTDGFPLLAPAGLVGDLPRLMLGDGCEERHELPIKFSPIRGIQVDVPALEPPRKDRYVGRPPTDPFDALHDDGRDVALCDALLHGRDARTGP